MLSTRSLSLTLAALVAGLLLSACGPEAERTRGGGAGGDVGNRTLGSALNIHGEVNSLYGEPQVVTQGAAGPGGR